MKLLNKISIALALIVFVSCESLDQNPYEDISTEIGFKSIDNAEYWRNGFYRSLRNVSSGGLILASDVQSDLLNATTSYGNRRGLIHSWKIDSGEDYLTSVWRYRYQAIASINKCIENFPTIPTSTADEKNKLDQYLGEAYALRAYYFFQIVQRFSPKYQDSNKNTPDLGIPLQKAYDVNTLPNRSTLEQTYEQIFSDIKQAETLLANKAGVKGSTTFTIDAVTALKARVYLEKQDYPNAYKYAKELVDAGKYPLVSTQEALQKIWYDDDVEESIVQLFVSNPDELPLLPDDKTSGVVMSNNIYLGYEAGNKKYIPDYVPSKWVVDLYEANDLRKAVYFKDLTVNLSGQDFTATLVHKYPGNKALYTGTTNYMHKPKIFRIAEFYLIAAEAAYKNGNENDAKEYLNDLRQKRGLANVTSSGTTLFEDIKKERLRELAFEGTRLDDLMRWGENVKRHDPQSTEYIMVNPTDQFYQLEKNIGNNMFIWPIPGYDIGINPNLKQNQGY